MFERVEAARAFSRQVFTYNHSRQGFGKSMAHAIASKRFATQTAFEVATESRKLHGANGLTKEYHIEKLFRDACPGVTEDGCNTLLSIIGADCRPLVPGSKPGGAASGHPRGRPGRRHPCRRRR